MYLQVLTGPSPSPGSREAEGDMGRRRTSAVVVAICLSLACLMSASGFLSPSPARSAIGRGSTTRRNSAAVRMMASKKDEVEVPDRLLSVVPYALPFFDGLDYGEGLFRVVPELREAVYAVFGSCLGIWHDLPFASFVYFLIVTVLARNPNLPRFIRFNMQQAVLLDVGLIVFGLVEGAVKFVSPGGAGA
jgi:hypothetical protein